MADSPNSGANRFKRQAVDVKNSEDGGLILRSPYALSSGLRSAQAWLTDRAETDPHRPFVVSPTGRQKSQFVTYGEMASRVEKLAAQLAERGLTATTPLAILSGNGADHAALLLAALSAGVPVASLAPSISLNAENHPGLRVALANLRPSSVFAGDGKLYAAALNAAKGLGCDILVGTSAPRSIKATKLSRLEKSPVPGSAEARTPGSAEARTPGSDAAIARIIYPPVIGDRTQGIVVNHRMRTAIQSGLSVLWTFLHAAPPVLLDRLSWASAVGANLVFDLVLQNGGTLLMAETADAKEIFELYAADQAYSPVMHVDTAAGIAELLNACELDQNGRDWFFQRLILVLTADTPMRRTEYNRLMRLAREADGPAPIVACCLGCAQAAAAVSLPHFSSDGPANLGLPLPESLMKLVPGREGYSAWIRGATTSPGCWTGGGALFGLQDSEGYVSTGLTVRLADAERPFRGLVPV